MLALVLLIRNLRHEGDVMGKRRVWPLVCEDSKSDDVLKFIHPLKQRSVAELISHTKEMFPDTKAVIVFGSAVTDKCHVGSDVDIVVVDSPRFFPPMCDVFDVVDVTGMKSTSPLVGQILKEGVVVYAK